MTLDELLALIRSAWPTKYERGRILHLQKTAETLSDGSVVHVRVLVQTIQEGTNEQNR